MNKSLPILAAAAALIFAHAADAHSLQLQCKKMDAGNIVCRTIMSDGEVLRNVDVQLVDEDNKVFASGKTDAEGKYGFKAPAGEYNVVVQANKAHVASLSSEDIW